jgi:hypothetical protein
MTDGKGQPMALWLKITIAVVVLGLISGLGLLAAGGMFLFNTAQQVMDPKKVSQVSDSIAKIEDPLPRGFSRIMAVDVMGLSEAGFTNTRKRLSIMLMKMPKSAKTTSADFLVDHCIKSGAPTGINTSGFANMNTPMEIQSRGRMVVGGEDMPYAIGLRQINNVKIFQMFGCVVPKRTGTPILILGQSTRTNSYNLESTKEFLAAIKSF